MSSSDFGVRPHWAASHRVLYTSTWWKTQGRLDRLYLTGRVRRASRGGLNRRSFLRSPVPAASRCFDDEDISWIHFGLVGATELLHRSIPSFDPVAAQCSRFPTIDPEGGHLPVAGKDGRRHRLAEDDPPPRSVTSPMPTRSPGAATDLEAFQEHGESPLEHLRIRQT